MLTFLDSCFVNDSYDKETWQWPRKEEKEEGEGIFIEQQWEQFIKLEITPVMIIMYALSRSFMTKPNAITRLWSYKHTHTLHVATSREKLDIFTLEQLLGLREVR